MIWVYYGNQDEVPLLIDSIMSVDKDFRGSYSFTSKVWSSHITRCIENQLDYTHLPYVHHNTIGRNFTVPQNPKFIKNCDGIKSFHQDGMDQPSSEYVFPNAWILHISNK